MNSTIEIADLRDNEDLRIENFPTTTTGTLENGYFALRKLDAADKICVRNLSSERMVVCLNNNGGDPISLNHNVHPDGFLLDNNVSIQFCNEPSENTLRAIMYIEPNTMITFSNQNMSKMYLTIGCLEDNYFVIYGACNLSISLGYQFTFYKTFFHQQISYIKVH